LALAAVAAEAAGIVEHQRRVLAAADGKRLGVADIHDQIVSRAVVAVIGQPAEPAKRLAAVRRPRVPESHRREMRQARMFVSTSVHHRQQPVFVQSFEADHRRMKTEAVGGLDDVTVRDSELWPRPVIGRVAVGNDGVQAVVAARQLDDDENSLRMLLDARALERLRRQRCRHAVQECRQSRCHSHAIQAAGEELATGTRESIRSGHLDPLAARCAHLAPSI
jgi:hypothetical protein